MTTSTQTMIPETLLVELFEDQLVKHIISENGHVVAVLHYIARQAGITPDEKRMSAKLPTKWPFEEYRKAVQKAQYQRKRAERYGLTDHFTAEDYLRLLDFYCHRCVKCGGHWHGMLTLDHIKPLSRGGSNLPSNLQFLCETCHIEKERIVEETGEFTDYRKQSGSNAKN